MHKDRKLIIWCIRKHLVDENGEKRKTKSMNTTKERLAERSSACEQSLN